YYRIRTVGSTAWVNAGSTKPVDANAAGQDVTISKFTQENATANGFANITAPGTVTLTEAINNETSSVWLNRAFDVSQKFNTQFDFRINTGTADGMAFVIQNYIPTAAVDKTQVRAIGGGGGGKGYASNVTNSVAMLFDIFSGIDQTGIYTNGAN